MSETDPLEGDLPFLIGSREQLQALGAWIVEFTRAVATRCGDMTGNDFYLPDLRALNKVLSTGCDFLDCLNPVDGEEFSKIIRELQKNVSTVLSDGLEDGLADLAKLSGEAALPYEKCLAILREAVPRFQWLDVRVRDELMKIDESPEVTGSGVAHSPDFRSMVWFGMKLTFTANQSPVIKMLYENWENGTVDVADETLLSAVDPAAPPARLNVLFRGHPAWGTMIGAGATKGTHRLQKSLENP